ncbi:hypothetical protein M426DRAFT_27175 [Hypoxylon sp. CI-4A]|nr:hypothetical protein M426DRAFT_27175 [Hypoxylon sp. CI-4A]
MRPVSSSASPLTEPIELEKNIVDPNHGHLPRLEEASGICLPRSEAPDPLQDDRARYFASFYYDNVTRTNSDAAHLVKISSKILFAAPVPGKDSTRVIGAISSPLVAHVRYISASGSYEEASINLPPEDRIRQLSSPKMHPNLKTTLLVLATALTLTPPASGMIWARFCDDEQCTQNCGQSVSVDNPGCLGREWGRRSVALHGEDFIGAYLVHSPDEGCGCQNDCTAVAGMGTPTCVDISQKAAARSYRFQLTTCKEIEGGSGIGNNCPGEEGFVGLGGST